MNLAFGILLLSFCFNLLGYSQNFTTSNQLLWQISGNGLKKPSYLFGSYHSNDPRVFKFSDSTYAAFLQTEALVLEADIYELFNKYDMRTNEVSLKFDAYGKPYTSSNKATNTKYGNEDGRPQFLDLYFQQIAYNMHKPFFALETIDQQLEVLEFVYEKSKAQKSLQQLKIIEDNLFLAYLNGDIEYVRSIILNQMDHSKETFDRLIDKRNAIMVNGIDTLCKKRSLFIAVGAAHLAGDLGIISLLRKKGYYVRQVIPSNSPQKSNSELKFESFNSYLYQDQKFNFSVNLSGKPIIDTLTSVYRVVYQEMGQGNSYLVEIEDFKNKSLENLKDVILDAPKNANSVEIIHQNKFKAYEGIGYDEFAGLCWKRIFVVDGKLVKLISYGGNKFMNSKRPQSFFDKVIFN